VALTGDELRALLAKPRASKLCEDHDLVDPITLLIATGLRRSELLGLRWTDQLFEPFRFKHRLFLTPAIRLLRLRGLSMSGRCSVIPGAAANSNTGMTRSVLDWYSPMTGAVATT
jgi:integrase